MSAMAANSNFTVIFNLRDISFLVETLIVFLPAFPESSEELFLMNVGQKATLLTFQLIFKTAVCKIHM